MSMAYVNEIYRIREGKLYFVYMYFTNANKKHELYRAFYLIKINTQMYIHNTNKAQTHCCTGNMSPCISQVKI